ncbi:MAG TPA: magnesium transporter CorA family protein [Longimicrobiales bacterium]|nr:magnesium transporter CorA family protein [Longimicrobiales bacterium]
MYTRYIIDPNEGIGASSEPGACVHVFVAPDEQEKAKILEQFRLDRYDLDSALDADEVARLETSGSEAFIVLKAPRNAHGADPSQLGVYSVGIILTESQLAFVSSEEALDFTAREFRHARDPADVLLAALLRTIRHYVGHLRVIKQISADLEKKITISLENRYLLQMFALGESLIYYSDAIDGNGAVLAKLRNAAGRLGISGPHLELLDDIILENNQASQQAHIYSSVLSGLMDARGTIVNNNMNVLLKNLTLINVIFLPLNLIASMGGMSEWSMMTRGTDWRLSYSLFAAGMVLCGWVTWFLMTHLIAINSGEPRRKRRRVR